MSEQEKIEQIKRDNRLIVRRLLREIAASNIQNPYYGRIEDILYEATGLDKQTIGAEIKK